MDEYSPRKILEYQTPEENLRSLLMMWLRPHHQQTSSKALYSGSPETVAFNIAIKDLIPIKKPITISIAPIISSVLATLFSI
ncbi:hypothetical protein ACI2OX_12435 [Bacillus sp. N9]